MLVRLTMPHEHAGKANPVGAEIDLPEADARYLISIDAAITAPSPTRSWRSPPSPIEGEGATTPSPLVGEGGGEGANSTPHPQRDAIAKISSKPKSQSQETKS